MRTIGQAAILGVLGALILAPVAASADPPAVGAPTIPPVFVGAPTNDNPNAGQFTVNFASDGTFEGTGTAAEPPLTRDLTPTQVHAYAQTRVSRADASTSTTNVERASTDRLFVNLASQLRAESSPVASTR